MEPLVGGEEIGTLNRYKTGLEQTVSLHTNIVHSLQNKYHVVQLCNFFSYYQIAPLF
jgi:hypothetical protein